MFQSGTKMLLLPSALPANVEAEIRWIKIRGHSMWPSLRPDDHAGVVRLRVHPRQGQVVVARQGNGLVAHRVLQTSYHSVTCVGDNYAAPDAPVPLSNLYGVVVLVRRRGRVLRGPDWDRGRSAIGSLRGRLIQGARRLMAVLS